MAQKITVVLEDDLDGGPASETVLFSLDGVAYEIDLNDGNAAGLRDAMAQYVGAGRRTGGRSASGRHTGAAAGAATAAPPRSAPGPATTATRSTSAAGCPPTLSPPTRSPAPDPFLPPLCPNNRAGSSAGHFGHNDKRR